VERPKQVLVEKVKAIQRRGKKGVQVRGMSKKKKKKLGKQGTFMAKKASAKD